MGEKYPMLPHTKASYPTRDAVPNWRLYKYTIKEQMQELIDAMEETKKERAATKKTRSEDPGDTGVLLQEVRTFKKD